MSACLPFEQAVQTLCRLANVRVSARSAERICLTKAKDTVKAFLAERESKNLDRAFAPVSSWSDFVRPAVLYLAADGECPMENVRWRMSDGECPMEDGSWKEMKVGVVRAEHSDGREAQASRYVNHLGGSSVFGSFGNP